MTETIRNELPAAGDVQQTITQGRGTTYFAYGSNMNPARVRDRGLALRDQQAAKLVGYRLAFNKMSRDHEGIGHANILFDRSAVVEGVIYHLTDAEQILRMDPFERAPWNYGREAVLVDTEVGPHWAWTYFANPAVCVEGLVPSADYLAHLLAGKTYLSPDYYQALLNWPTA